jgi:hypothetical protein
MSKHKFFYSVWDIKAVDKDGSILWQHKDRNMLVNEGERLILTTMFRDEDTPSAYYVRAGYGELTEETVLASIPNEPEEAYGYEPQLIERSGTGFPVLELVEGDYMITTKQLAFTASGGNIGPINYLFISTTSDDTGKLMAVMTLPNEYTIYDGTSLQFTISIKAI